MSEKGPFGLVSVIFGQSVRIDFPFRFFVARFGEIANGFRNAMFGAVGFRFSFFFAARLCLAHALEIDDVGHCPWCRVLRCNARTRAEPPQASPRREIGASDEQWEG